MALADLNLNKWTLSVLVLCQKETASQPPTPWNNEFLFWLDNWRRNEEGWGRGRGGVMEGEGERQSKGAPYFLVIAMREGAEVGGGATAQTPLRHFNLLSAPLPRSKKTEKGEHGPKCPELRSNLPVTSPVPALTTLTPPPPLVFWR